MGILQWLNQNIRCIEIVYGVVYVCFFDALNQNIRCIEM